MSYTIEILCPAKKFLDKLSRSQPKHFEAIEDAVEDLAEDLRPHGCKALTGLPKLWRIRVGDYRVCYTINDGKLLIVVVTISTRDEVYELLRRYIN